MAGAPSAALLDARRLLEALLLQDEPGPWGAAAAGAAGSGGVEIVTFDDGDDGNSVSAEGGASFGSSSGGTEPLSGGSWASGGGGGFGFGGARRAAREAAIARLAASEAPRARAEALEALAAPRGDADDLLCCEGWPALCGALPLCLIAPEGEGEGEGDSGGGGGGSTDGGAAAAASLLRRLAPTLLDCAPEALAQLLAPLLTRLVDCGVGAPPAPPTAAGRLPRLREPWAVGNPATTAAGAEAVSAAEAVAGGGLAGATAAALLAPNSEQQALLFALRALHAFGRQWHLLPQDEAVRLCCAVLRLALQWADGNQSPGVDGGRAAGSGGGPREGGSGGSSRGAAMAGAPRARTPALEALLAFDPDLLWWRRLFAVAAFKRDALAAAGPNGALAGAFADALLPAWRGGAAAALPWQRAAAAAVTESLLDSGPGPRAALLLAGGGAGREGLDALERDACAWLAAANAAKT
ncbi:hypothetical protein Rsub_09156 [Raphidocelis subcapitata]|uniref:Uncharacterized protein n=1 Tax=Raphidocelis subcapitata TaxID=307507 RepID=A0A2V0PF89_9CHLO|nr:hypothetical protein Rsub_09156 [Raphidocelis subcapitata]|eukprot:GBF96573.1 hypothetical protein Rsub_09156 [Raphidocelis subcapitata]